MDIHETGKTMITILMAVFKGEKYIAEQIESILNQTEKSWKLVIQDDCSTDKTSEIAQKYVEKYPGKVSFVQLITPSGSAGANFLSMLKYADTEYMMTCDQDDVWLPDKIEVTLKEMYELEEKFGYDKPLLVHTDLKVVNEELNVISDSMFALQNLNSSRNHFNNILIQNIVTGCTLMVNQALLAMACGVLQQAIMHDWWFALIAAAFGQIGFVNEPTLLYRQHDNNEVGAKNAKSLSYNLNRLLSREQSKSVLQGTYIQAESFLGVYKNQLTTRHLQIVKEYISLPRYNKIKRLQTILKFDFWKTGFFRKCGQILFM